MGGEIEVRIACLEQRYQAPIAHVELRIWISLPDYIGEVLEGSRFSFLDSTTPSVWGMHT